MICKICENEVTQENHFWKVHHLSQEDYYTKYYPRFCKFSKELLPFKNKENYFNNDFKGKREMAAWFKENSGQVAKDYAIALLKKRIERKKLIYAPCQTELRSLLFPSMIWFKQNFDSYNDLCSSLGLKIRFDLENEVPIFRSIKNEAIILVDSREQKSLKFSDYKTKIQGLKFGDYALEPNRFKVHIERKGLSDLAATFGTGFERFCREVIRAKRERAYLIILVEASINDALHFNYLPYMKYCKVSPDYCFKHIRDLMQTFENIQFVFAEIGIPERIKNWLIRNNKKDF